MAQRELLQGLRAEAGRGRPPAHITHTPERGCTYQPLVYLPSLCPRLVFPKDTVLSTPSTLGTWHPRAADMSQGASDPASGLGSPHIRVQGGVGASTVAGSQKVEETRRDWGAGG